VCAAGRTLHPLPVKGPKTVKLQLQTSRPYNIAHRGSNGEIPEETTAAYLKAIEEGTDFIETDILSSKDGVLICFHDCILDETTNVASHKEFADRKRTYDVQGFNITGFFTFDFTLKELKQLRIKQRYAFRDQQYNGLLAFLSCILAVGRYKVRTA
jgi:glycerophosphoryl diester phosphodiesterase